MELYDPKILNGKHAVYYSNTFNEIQRYYFDFETETWIKCYPVNRLPYGLCSYRLEGFDNDKCVVTTCDNSYRLTTDLDNVLSTDEMKMEREWRENIVKNGAELDYINPLQDYADKARVCWTKSDIIPGVILIGPRKHPNLNSFGYFYKESNNLAKSCTYTNEILENELEKEKQLKEEAIRINNEFDQKLAEYKKVWPYLCSKEYAKYASTGWYGFYDIRQFYAGLNFCNEPITKEFIIKAIVDQKREGVTDVEKIYGSDLDKMCLFCIILFPDYDVVYNNMEYDIKNNSISLNEHDAYADIKIFGATYAYLKLGDEKINLDLDADNNFTFTDITVQNPLFCTTCGDSLTIHTDGNKMTCKIIEFSNNPRKIIKCTGLYAVSWLNSRNLVIMAGHCWQPSYVCKIDELVKVELDNKLAKVELE